MKIAGIVAEYNPFHNGHAYQIAKAREAGATHIVAVMTGNYSQRGTAAQFEKHVRTRAALCAGVDLVIELPLAYAVSTAERFALGALTLMQALGCVEMVSFGAESPLEQLLPLARELLSPALSPLVKRHLSHGMTFAKARQLALEEPLGQHHAALLQGPNNILAVEYLKAAKRIGFAPEFCAVTRVGAGHDSDRAEGTFASASHLRALCGGAQGLEALRDFVPHTAYEIYQKAWEERLIPAQEVLAHGAMLAVLRRMRLADFSCLPDVSEGLENRLYAAVRQACSVDEIYTAAKSKRYSMSRIRRLVLSGYLGITAQDAQTLPPYLRVLGFGKGGLEVLAEAKKTALLPVSPSLAQLERENTDCARFALLEARAADLYSLTLPEVRGCGFDYTCPPVMLK